MVATEAKMHIPIHSADLIGVKAPLISSWRGNNDLSAPQLRVREEAPVLPYKREVPSICEMIESRNLLKRVYIFQD